MLAEQIQKNEIIPEEQENSDYLLRLRDKLLPPYKVILHNDDRNDMIYVVSVLVRYIDYMTTEQAMKVMLVAHLQGNAIVAVCPKEQAEYYQQRLISSGLTATIERK